LKYIDVYEQNTGELLLLHHDVPTIRHTAAQLCLTHPMGMREGSVRSTKLNPCKPGRQNLEHISLGYPGRPMPDFSPKPSTYSGGREAGCNGVWAGPGATALTRMSLGMRFFPKVRVKEVMAPFAEA
jgi:hypothetical protein